MSDRYYYGYALLLCYDTMLMPPASRYAIDTSRGRRFDIRLMLRYATLMLSPFFATPLLLYA